MKESYREGVASHPGPEPCKGGRKAALEALDRGICRLGMELRNRALREADGVRQSGRPQGGARQRERAAVPRSRRPQACRETPCARAGRPRSRPQVVSGPGGEGDEPQVLHARRRGVERLHSTDEVPEQSRGIVGGGHGGKVVGQGDFRALGRCWTLCQTTSAPQSFGSACGPRTGRARLSPRWEPCALGARARVCAGGGG
jgi:hypothetical protein